jgi:AcrR family transcriptional regulator
MVQIIHSGENVLRINTILKAAQKRFGMYGLEKTTMSEIAKDVGISKASLYYYFPDKEHLYKEVVEMEQASFFELVDKNLQEAIGPEKMLKNFMDIRLNYFRTFFNLSRLRLEEFRHMKPMLEDTLNVFRKREVESLEIIIRKGIDKGEFFTQKPNEISSLFLEMVRGVRSLVFHNKDLMYVEPEDYEILVRKMNDITDMFIKSLKYKE